MNIMSLLRSTLIAGIFVSSIIPSAKPIWPFSKSAKQIKKERQEKENRRAQKLTLENLEYSNYLAIPENVTNIGFDNWIETQKQLKAEKAEKEQTQRKTERDQFVTKLTTALKLTTSLAITTYLGYLYLNADGEYIKELAQNIIKMISSSH